MQYSDEYNDLLEKYRKLQLRTTRFSAIEQELINTRDRLDYELESYKRLSQYSYFALESTNENHFFSTITEAIIDVLEVEVAVVYFNHLKNPQKSKVYTEGIVTEKNQTQLSQEIISLNRENKLQKPGKVLVDSCANYSVLSKYAHILFSAHNENALGYEIYFLGMNSLENASLYQTIEERHETLFAVLVQQMQSLLANRKRREQIENQVKLISKSEKELKKLSLIATKTNSGVIITDAFGRIEWTNNAFTNLTGYSLAEIIGKKPKDFLQGPKSDQKSIKRLATALKNKQDIEISLINYTKQGEIYYNNLEIISVFDDKNKHINFIAIQKDITEDTRAKQEILRMNSRFELITNKSKIGIWEWTPENNTVVWNEINYEIYGLNPKETKIDLYEFWKKSIHEDFKDVTLQNIQKILDNHSDHTQERIKIRRNNDKSERILDTVTIAERDEHNKLIRLLGSSRDITAKAELQESLQNAIKQRDDSIEKTEVIKTFYERILTHSPSQILVFDNHLNLTYSNISKSEKNNNWNIPLNTSLHDLAKKHDNNRLKAIIDSISQAKKTGQVVQIEDSFFNEKNEQVHFIRSILPYFSEKDKLENIIIIGLEISEVKRIQADIILKNTELRKINLELDNFVYSISHDLRSPLLSVKGIISFLLQKEALSENAIKFLNLATDSINRLDTTIQEILEYSRNAREHIKYEKFNLSELVKVIFKDLKFANEKNIDFILKNQDPCWIETDKSRINILLKNIIGNSVKYTRENVKAFVEVNWTYNNEQLTITITDNGEGIDEIYLPKIFDMFFRATTSSIGTGLGLYICKEITNKLSGKIKVKSTKKLGTTFSVQLPLKRHFL